MVFTHINSMGLSQKLHLPKKRGFFKGTALLDQSHVLERTQHGVSWVGRERTGGDASIFNESLTLEAGRSRDVAPAMVSQVLLDSNLCLGPRQFFWY